MIIKTKLDGLHVYIFNTLVPFELLHIYAISMLHTELDLFHLTTACLSEHTAHPERWSFSPIETKG